MLHKKFDFDSSSTTLGEEDATQPREGAEYRISDQEAVRCALSIPEEFVPTPHKEFIKERQQLVRQNRMKERPIGPMTTPAKTTKPSIQNGGEGEYRISKAILVRERERKLRSAFAKYKKWDEAERCTVERLPNNKIMINDEYVMDINHSDYIMEKDVVLELDEDYRTCSMPPSPFPRPPTPPPVDPPTVAVGSASVGGTGGDCKEKSCRLGCICESIKREKPIVRSHCGKPRCFFECTCSQSLFSNGDDSDIRSRLRPRVSLLNWRFMESAERDKDPPPVNYRQLERGVTVYPRMRRVAVAPQRFRNEYIMSNKFKDTFNRERRKPVGGISKFIRKSPTTSGVNIKPNSSGTMYRRNFLVNKPSVNNLKENSPIKNTNVRPSSVSIDPSLKPDDSAIDEESPPELEEQEPLEVPNLVKVIQRDAMIVLMGVDDLCFVTFTLQYKHPRAIMYKEMPGDRCECPWLYLPFTSSGESWLFHPFQENDEESTFTSIPEINCVIPTKAIRLHLNQARLKQKTVALKMLWVGPDSKERHGTIYMLPALPKVLICGPFPHYLMKTRFNSDFHHLDRIMNACAYVDTLGSAKQRTVGDVESWNTFYRKKKERINAELQERVRMDNAANALTNNLISEMAIMESMSPANSYESEQDQEVSSSELDNMEEADDMINIEPDKLCVSWNDAAHLLSVQP